MSLTRRKKSGLPQWLRLGFLGSSCWGGVRSADTTFEGKGRSSVGQEEGLVCHTDLSLSLSAPWGAPEQRSTIRGVLHLSGISWALAPPPSPVTAGTALRRTCLQPPLLCSVIPQVLNWEKYDLDSKAEADPAEINSWRFPADLTAKSWVTNPFITGDLSSTFPCLPWFTFCIIQIYSLPVKVVAPPGLWWVGLCSWGET